MKMDLIEGLLQTSIYLNYKGKRKQIDHVVIDTGAAHSIISSDAVDDIDIYWTPEDEIVDSIGIGGVQNSFIKNIDEVVFAGVKFTHVPLDFGFFNPELNINGLIGLDILLKGQFQIDLGNLTISSTSH